jgi:hypothetical protein
MNVFMVLIAVLYLGAAGWEWFKGSRLLTVVYLSWSVSNFVLAVKR